MRLVLIHCIDLALSAAPQVQPTLYVDDLSAEVAGPEDFVARQLVTFTTAFCRYISSNFMTISPTKSYCSASVERLGRRIAAALSQFGVRYRGRVASLGVGLGAGTRRNAAFLKKRLS